MLGFGHVWPFTSWISTITHIRACEAIFEAWDTVLSHSLLSLDIDPCNIFLFPKLRKFLSVRSLFQVLTSINRWFRGLPKSAYRISEIESEIEIMYFKSRGILWRDVMFKIPYNTYIYTIHILNNSYKAWTVMRVMLFLKKKKLIWNKYSNKHSKHHIHLCTLHSFLE